MTTLITTQKIVLDPTIPLGLLISEDSYYRGQLDNVNRAHGVGIASGKWGIYEGQFSKGYADGIGRIFDKNGTKYDGQFKNGKYDAQDSSIPLIQRL